MIIHLPFKNILAKKNYLKYFQCMIHFALSAPFTNATTSHYDHFWPSPLGGCISESLLYIKTVRILC